MAEPISSIVTLATVSLAIIKETASFIQAAKVVDETIAKLLSQLIDLRRLIKLVRSTCGQAPERDNDHASRFIQDALTRCRSKLENVETLVQGLASRPSKTFFQKATLNIRTNHSRRAIDESIKDIERLSDLMHKGVGLWTLQVTHEIHRQNSQAVPQPEVTTIRTDLQLLQQQQRQQVIDEDSISPLSRTGSTFSQTETVYEPPSRRASSIIPPSRASISSSSTHSYRRQSNRNDSIISEEEPPKPNSDWVEFHYQVKVCDGKDARIQAIHDALQQHADGSSLANSKDGSKRSPLHWAAQRGDIKLAQILLDFGADVNAKDSQPCSVLDLAVAHNHDAFVELLIQHRVDETAISKQNRFRFEEMKEAIDLRKSKLEKSTRKDRKRIRTGIEA